MIKRKPKVSDSDLWRFIFDDHGADAYDFYALQKKVANMIMANPQSRRIWELKYLKEQKEMNDDTNA